MGVETVRAIRDPLYYWREASLNTPTWEGNGAKILGMHDRTVDRETFLNLCAGYTTKDGGRDRKLPRYMRGDRRPAFDMTFNLPKCGSLLKELGGDTRITGVVENAMRSALREVEREMQVKHPWQQPDNLIYTFVGHPGSREGDPHSHYHAVIFNLSETDKGWKAIEPFYLDMPKIAGIFRDEAMKGFRQCGYKLRREGAEYCVMGVPAEVKARFSRRHERIEQIGEELERKKGAPLTSKARSRLSLYDRPEKPDDKPIEERRKDWVGELTDSEHRRLLGVVSRSKAVLKQARWRDESRSAFDRMQQPEQAPERSADRGRSR